MIVTEPRFDPNLGKLCAPPEVTPCLFGKILLREAVEVASCRLRPKRHGAIEPYRDFRFGTLEQVTAKIGRNLDGEFELAAAQSLLDLRGAFDLGPLREIA